jgi:hypothetical protein
MFADPNAEPQHSLLEPTTFPNSPQGPQTAWIAMPPIGGPVMNT